MERFFQRDIGIPIGNRVLACTIASGNRLKSAPYLLIVLACSRQEMLQNESYYLPALPFTQSGNLALFYDIPCHGDRMDAYGSGIIGFRDSFLAGKDVFAQSVEEVDTIIDYVLENGIASQVAICGISRGGYLAYRSYAHSKRLSGAALVSPVTDWTRLVEFQHCREIASIRALNLGNFIPVQDERTLFLSVGSHDDRVDTISALEFYISLARSRKDSPQGSRATQLHVTEDFGHSSGTVVLARAGEQMLLACHRQDGFGHDGNS